MSFTYSDLNAVLTHEQEENLDNDLIDLSLVCSIFDEEIGPIYFYDTYVPLVVFLIFPKKHLGTYAKIAISLEDFISKKFGNGLSQIPALKTLEDFIKQLYTKIRESRLV